MGLFLRKRKVRIHLKDEDRSLEGIWVGFAAGHYRLVAAKQIENSERSFLIEGEAWVPRENVLYVQPLVEVAR